MTEALYWKDSYVKDFEAKIVKLDGNKVFLDKTYFYAAGGGQPCDAGKLICDNNEAIVVNVRKEDGEIVHEVDNNFLKEHDAVKGIIDWERRYKLMRMHTATHVLCAVIHKETGALITGNQLDVDKTRIDFNLENFDREKINEYFKNANEIVMKDMKVSVEFISREEAEKDSSLVKLAMGMPSHFKEVRIVNIGDFDRQADGGTHVHSTKEIRELRLVGCENKGKNNRRIYFELV